MIRAAMGYGQAVVDRCFFFLRIFVLRRHQGLARHGASRLRGKLRRFRLSVAEIGAPDLPGGAVQRAMSLWRTWSATPSKPRRPASSLTRVGDRWRPPVHPR